MLPGTVVPAVFNNSERASAMQSATSSSSEDTSGSTDRAEHAATEEQQPKASFYEKLRRAGSRKPKARK